MADVQHGALRPGVSSGVHVVQGWEVADAAARLALVVSATDEGRVCRQLDDNSFWVLRTAAPAAWARLDNVATGTGVPVALGATLAEGTASTLARSDHVHTLSAADRAKLDAAGPSTPLTGTAPAAVTKAAAAAGVATDAARSDHKHDVTTAAPLALGAALAEGTSASLARADHVHTLSAADRAKLDAAGPSTPLSASAPVAVSRAAAAVGGATEAARADHKHDIATAAPTFIGTSNQEGTATTLARSDHVHAGLAVSSVLPLDVTKANASYGSALTASRSDHKHSIATAAPVALGAANSEGASTSLARSDHVHDASNKADKNLTITSWSSTTLTLAAAHNNALIVFDGTADALLTLPSDAMVALPDGFTVNVLNRGENKLTVNDVNVYYDQINAPPTSSFDVGPRKMVTLIKMGANNWIGMGGFGAVEATL
jgi:hypothetical protein